MEQGSTTRSQQAAISPALAATSPALAAPLTLHGNDRSLAEMAQRDLDAALQLLTERAQYITGANGAAIALRRNGKKDMLCRAATGSNAPELGALLSTELGLSGESVRTRRPLRCDDAATDARVNREVCRKLGIASVVVMPVVDDDEVLGVFELFSGVANAFGERDLSTLQRLSQMVETAVKLACTAEALPLPVPAEVSPVEVPATNPADAPTKKQVGPEIIAAPALAATVELPSPGADEEDILEPEEPVIEMLAEPATEEHTPVAAIEATPSAVAAPPIAAPEKPTPQAAVAPKPLFWSIAQASESPQPSSVPDQSHVPPGLRNLSSCQACGFPVSPGRILCVECEEKKWRGQLRGRKPIDATLSTPSPRAMAAAATVGSPRNLAPAVAPPKAEPEPVKVVKSLSDLATAPEASAKSFTESSPVAVPPPTFTLSSGLASESWFSSKKYILAVLLLIAGAAAAVRFLH